ncbi:MAG TPA: alanine racemase [Candidatus Mediterraneibacter stercoripullorum]|nr:alanine racemase [Candidatus Mediterraneibacter stercoripullorum]
MRTEQLEYACSKFGTPLYIFDLDILRVQTERIREKLGEGIGLCYAMKANPFLTAEMAEYVDRIEVCSMGEFRICRDLKIPPEKLFISGVLKKKKDLMEILEYCGGRCAYTVESVRQFQYLLEWSDRKAQRLRLYPRLTSGNQFGMDEETIQNIIRIVGISPYLEVEGIHFFSGTQKKNVDKHRKELKELDGFFDKLHRELQFDVRNLEYGPGTAVPYFRGKEPETFTDDGLHALGDAIRDMKWTGQVTIELGRALAALCGYYLTEIRDVKQNGETGYCIVDGGSHQLNYDGQIKGMYEPYIKILPEGMPGKEKNWTVCGSLCTVNDVLCRGARLSGVKTGKVLVFERAGAYSCMEGMALFLSHELPGIVSYDDKNGWKQLRSQMETYRLNMPE